MSCHALAIQIFEMIAQHHTFDGFGLYRYFKRQAVLVDEDMTEDRVHSFTGVRDAIIAVDRQAALAA
jgi:hypothetical protein